MSINPIKLNQAQINSFKINTQNKATIQGSNISAETGEGTDFKFKKHSTNILKKDIVK